MRDYPSLTALSLALHQKKISSVELTKQYLKKIQASSLNAFINLDEEGAIIAAAAADIRMSQGTSDFLTGIPLAHKDLFCTHRLPTTAASKMLENYISPFEATLVKKLRDQGTVLLGKTNMDEFAMGSATDHSYFGPVLNPWDSTRVPGGSSGGSAAAVAADLIPFATGSDTGGSIRQPAAFCGISGLKPTYGLVSRYGMIAYASSLDQAGPMAKSAEDLAYILSAMAGFDPQDSTSSPYPKDFNLSDLNSPIDALRIGLPRSFLKANIDLSIQQAMQQMILFLEQKGHTIVEIDFSTENLWVPCYYVIACAEASANLSRYDGIRFGYRTQNAPDIVRLMTRSRSEGFGQEVKRRILIGTHVLSSGYYDAYYLQAQKVRRMIQDEINLCFSQVDMILSPTTPTLAFKRDQPIDSAITRYLGDQFTVTANLTGFPALSIPAGMSHHLPIGLQLIGPPFSDMRLIHIAHQFQQETDWHLKTPGFGATLI